MALCSSALNAGSNKRNCNFPEPSCAKRSCFSLNSSSEDGDSDDDQSCYKADQVRAKRRASTRVSFLLNSELSKAVSKYSDDDSSVEADQKHENIDCQLSLVPSCKNFMQISDSSIRSSPKKVIPESDSLSRSRCFEYLVGSIDEAWARYCDATTCAEDQVYGYETPVSVVTDDDEYFGNSTDLTDYDEPVVPVNSEKLTKKRGSITCGDSLQKSSLAYGNSLTPSVVKEESSQKLQALKDRLTKAKYFLQDLVDSDNFDDVSSFWRRWDMIKYATIELVEDDDDDEIIESTIEELEEGRLFMS